VLDLLAVIGAQLLAVALTPASGLSLVTMRLRDPLLVALEGGLRFVVGAPTSAIVDGANAVPVLVNAVLDGTLTAAPPVTTGTPAPCTPAQVAATALLERWGLQTPAQPTWRTFGRWRARRTVARSATALEASRCMPRT
jgi:hypothetical protein